MSNVPLRVCPKCMRPFDADIGLASGEVLNCMCPGNNGPSDIDHVIHNTATDRIAIYEYKSDASRPLPRGQEILLDAMTGDWVEEATGRKLSIRYWVVGNGLTAEEAVEEYAAGREWVWPSSEWRETYRKLYSIRKRKSA